MVHAHILVPWARAAQRASARERERREREREREKERYLGQEQPRGQVQGFRV